MSIPAKFHLILLMGCVHQRAFQCTFKCATGKHFLICYSSGFHYHSMVWQNSECVSSVAKATRKCALTLYEHQKMGSTFLRSANNFIKFTHTPSCKLSLSSCIHACEVLKALANGNGVLFFVPRICFSTSSMGTISGTLVVPGGTYRPVDPFGLLQWVQEYDAINSGRRLSLVGRAPKHDFWCLKKLFYLSWPFYWYLSSKDIRGALLDQAESPFSTPSLCHSGPTDASGST